MHQFIRSVQSESYGKGGIQDIFLSLSPPFQVHCFFSLLAIRTNQHSTLPKVSFWLAHIYYVQGTRYRHSCNLCNVHTTNTGYYSACSV